YFTVKRSHLVPALTVFDAPDALQGLAVRSSTTVAPQALMLLNDPQVRACARAFAERVRPDPSVSIEDAVGNAYLLAFSRPATAQERRDARDFRPRQAAPYAADGDKAAARALADFCQTLLCSNEFVYLD